MESIRRFFDPPERSFFLLGPRGTGKSTWLRTACPDALTLDLLRPDVFRDLSARPERLEGLVGGTAPTATVVLDEVQRVPELLAVVHRLIETPGTSRRFILTGSSARKLRRGGTDLLGGRASMCTMHPFMAAELGRFDLADALRVGLLPIVVASASPDEVLRAYASLYLDEEVRQEGLTRNVGAFARFLEVASFSHGAVVNTANLARECQVERKSVANYLGILEDLLLAFRVPVFTRRAQRATSVHPKLYYFDAGVY
ncbi:MAG: ATP-binding protein, partial [Candidatus Binatia bacterium]